ncbi:COMM domain-containing protein 1-like isoform X1 [Tachypleus tridentatus]|uniref:COMM domain-containing protein 1-like isoform X1 n=1 Tax=Tachypleus tridentatus TaxID=6853 RepID=UPI003FD18C0D
MMAEETSQKSLLGLLNGLARREYYGDASVTNEFLHHELYPDLSVENFNQIVDKSLQNIRRIAESDMDTNQLEAFLTSQTKRKEGGLTDDEVKVFTRFWKNHRSRIHDILIQRCQWTPSLKALTWRVDLKSQTKNNSEVNSPVAIFDIQLKNQLNDTREDDKIRFEVSEEQLTNIIEKLEEVETLLCSYT